MKRVRQHADVEEGDLDGKAANTQSTEGVNPTRKRRIQDSSGMKDLNREPSSRTQLLESAATPPSSFVDMSVIHGRADSVLNPAASSPTFPYEPLDDDTLQIRVVILRAAADFSPIQCDLEHVATKQTTRGKKKTPPPPSYKALSYTWGSPEVHKTIFLNGIEVQVRENLWLALYHLRSPSADLRLWIDAVCINQEDILERNRQVSRMGTIYGMANEVLVWLGPEIDDSQIAMEFIEKTTSARKGQLPLNYFVDHLVSSTPTKRAISKFIERDYWKRVWIIQEVFRARKIAIHCGTSVLPWPYLAKFFRLLNETFSHERLPPLQISRLSCSLPANLTRQRTGKLHNLETLLETYKLSLCTDVRDRVYSLIGLAGRRLTDLSVLDEEYGHEWISVDYTKSPLDIYWTFCMNFMHSREFDADTDGETVHLREARVRRMQLFQEVLTLKFSPLEPIRLVSEASVNMSCPAFDQDQVGFVSPPWSRNSNNSDEQHIILDWHRTYHMGMPQGLDSLEPVIDSFSDEDLARVQPCRFAWIPTAKRTIDMKTSPCPIPLSVECAVAGDTTLPAYSKARFFTTRGGHLGIAPLNAKSKDIVYRFRGCDIALIVRRNLRGAEVIGRAMILKSERTLAWEAGTSMAEFRYAVPRVSTGLHDEITLPLEEWRSLTW